MNIIELNNRKYTLISEIMRIDSADVIKKIEELINRENMRKKSPISFTLEELKQEIADSEKEIDLYSLDEVKAMSWKK